MKELEKVKRISISSTLFILAVLIGLLTYERPENIYAMDTRRTLENLTDADYLISLSEINNPEVALIDIRSQYEFEKGHLEKAINIPTAEILREENKAIFQELKDSQKLTVLYGKDLEEANLPFLLLYQMGYDNLKLLSTNNKYLYNELITQPDDIEKPIADIQAFIDESVKKANAKVEVKKVPVPKQVVPIKKKKKRPVEGGC
ncbi:rhodanese-like domain-containing protein [Salinimicrobium flavum]|uniref:Rhodanese-like domain-containing protein n=1 Tax=Salinimicrobium flavum TaxID=1737065 RepID=A0ABW5IZ88_9FLAO